MTLLAFSKAATGPNLYFAQPSGSVSSNSEVSLTVHEDSGSQPVAGVETTVGYDKTQLQFVGFTESGPMTQILSSNGSTQGTVTFARAIPLTAQPLTGDNEVVTLRFKVLATSGSPALSFDDSVSSIYSTSNSANVLASTQGTTLTVSSGQSTDSAQLSLNPAATSAAPGSTVTFTIVENSGQAFVSGVDASVTYDPAKLQYTGVTEGQVFTTVLSTDTSHSGVIDVVRGLPLGGSSSGVSGQNQVAKLAFKVLATSGSATVNIDKAASTVSSAKMTTDVLSATSGGTVTINAPSTGGSATLNMQPSSGTFTTGSTVSVAISLNAGSASIMNIEPILTYPTNQLQFVDATPSADFPLETWTRDTNGTLDVLRAVPLGSTPVTGTKTGVTLNFRVIGTSGTASLAFTSAAAIYDNSGTADNIMDQANSHGATFTISSSTNTQCITPPTAPGSPTVSGQSYTSVNLSWTASTAGAKCTLAGYHILRNGTAIGDTSGATTFQDSGLTAGTQYTYTIQAFDTSAHTSSLSSAVQVTTKADDQAPTVPSGLTAVSSTSATVGLSWTASSDLPNPGGTGVAGYHVYRTGTTTPVGTVTSGVTYTDANVTAGTTYTYTVKAFDKVGNESAPSNVVSVQTPTSACSGQPTAPANVTLGTVDLTTASFSWNAASASSDCQLVGYKIFRNSTLVGTTADTTFTDQNLQPGTSYAYTIRSYDSSAHMSVPSLVLAVSTSQDTTPPTAPGSLTAAAVSGGTVSLNWTEANDNVAVTSYKVYRNGALARTVSGTVLTFTDTSLTPNTDYTYAISAVDAAGNESAKTQAAPSPIHTPASTDSTAPTVPSGLHMLAVTDSSVAFSWTASTDAVGVSGYKVYRGSTFLGDVTTTSFVDTGLTPGTGYDYTVKAFDASGNVSAASTALTVQTLGGGSTLIGDFNVDGKVDIYDLSIMLKNWQLQDVPAGKGDLTGDGTVNDDDVSVFVNHYGEHV